MHNGALATLDDVIDFYDRGGGKDPKKSPLLKPLGLTRSEKEALKDFLSGGMSGAVPTIRPPRVP
jgi:cytochrome c peroxidase